MSIPLLVLVAIALAAVLTVLLMGVWNLARGNNPERSQKLMQWRVALQFLALAIVLIVILVSQHYRANTVGLTDGCGWPQGAVSLQRRTAHGRVEQDLHAERRRRHHGAGHA